MHWMTVLAYLFSGVTCPNSLSTAAEYFGLLNVFLSAEVPKYIFPFALSFASRELPLAVCWDTDSTRAVRPNARRIEDFMAD
jgi:hypothetical protein